MTRPTRTPHGFTLIELLVVISIIALLISILLPALRKARESGMAVQCLSQERQIGVAVIIYQDDYDGFYPGYYRVSGGAQINEPWAARLTFPKYNTETEVFRCPSEQELRTDFVDPANVATITSTNWRRVHYAVNTDHVWSNRQFTHYPERGPATWQSPVRQVDVTDPAKTINFADSFVGPASTVAGGASDYMQGQYQSTFTGGMPWARHGGTTQINVAWCDGHASPVIVNNPQIPWDTGLTSFATDRQGSWWDVYPH